MEELYPLERVTRNLTEVVSDSGGPAESTSETEPGRQALYQGWFSKERIWFLRKRRKKII